MKKIFSKKYLLIIVFAFIFFASASLVLFAADYDEQPFYRVNKEKSNVGVTTGIATKLGTSTIINRSSQ